MRSRGDRPAGLSGAGRTSRMLPIVLPVAALLSGTALLLLGIGLLNTLLVLRGALEGFSDGTLGLIGSSYFAGFLVGTWLCPRLIRRMGHIRAFAFFTAAATACVLGHLLVVHAGVWMVLRVITGASMVGLYLVIESWLNSHAGEAQRGKVFAAYMVCNLGALALAQQLLGLDSPGGHVLFVVAAAFVCLAAMPVTATQLAPPVLPEVPPVSLRRCWRAAPVAVASAVLSGLAMGGFWGLAAVYLRRLGADAAMVADFMSATILGGVALQWPIGHFSDGADRRRTLAAVGVAACVAALAMMAADTSRGWLLAGAFAYGGMAFAVYPVAAAHLIDHLHQDEILSGNSAVILLHGSGAALGPLLAGGAMALAGPLALPAHFLLMHALLAGFALWWMRREVDEIVDAPAHFVPMVRTSHGAMEMMAADQGADTPAADGPTGSPEKGDDTC